MSKLTTQHPMLMVPNIVSMSVVVYTNGGRLHIDPEAVRKALIDSLPAGTGVSSVSCMQHGVYEGQQGATS